MQCQATTPDELEAFGAQLARRVRPSDVIFLQGPLGAGKTTLVRGMLHALGVEGAVTSPTYTLIEPYKVSLDNGDGRVERADTDCEVDIWHFDLYRVEDSEELELMGARDCFSQTSICLIEWPDRGDGFLPPPTATINIEVEAGTGVRQVLVDSSEARLR